MRKQGDKPLMKPAPREITQLLKDWSGGDQAALDRLMPLVYDELHRLAHQYMRREQPGHILQTSALINEAYLRMIDQPQISWENRSHFFGIAARVMRRILVDAARKRNSAKGDRGGIQVSRNWQRLTPRLSVLLASSRTTRCQDHYQGTDRVRLDWGLK
jgi:RNA polymerase sigma factor (TIGR02999 family)